ncbi:FSTL1, partial [Cervus elaphus hippelaphus]
TGSSPGECFPDGFVFQEQVRSKSKICANVFCGAGRECAVTEKGEPTCLCIEQCKPHKRPVCGSNGKTYLNHCELHRDACLTGSKIQVDYDGHCKEKKSVSPSASPVVCYQSNRDELRRRIIQWLEAEIIPDGWFSKGSNYSEILDKYFKNFDNGDSRLDSSEFLKFVEQNETAINITTYADQENNKLLRGLCVDALIELSDENADWKLSFQEFLKCLNPSFNPPEKKCALEDETYADGAETEVDCNRCVCACGNWVCTAMTCDGKNQKGAQTQAEEEMTRYVQELQKHQRKWGWLARRGKARAFISRSVWEKLSVVLRGRRQNQMTKNRMTKFDLGLNGPTGRGMMSSP